MLFSVQRLNFGCIGAVMLPDTQVPVADIVKWFGKSIDDFILYSHGAAQLDDPSGKMRHADWRDLAFWPTSVQYASGKPNSVVIHDALKGGQPTFVFLDTCHSAGGSMVTKNYAGVAPGNTDLTWVGAFNVDPGWDSSQVFMGWNGNSDSGTGLDKAQPPKRWFDDWYQWRSQFYYELTVGQTVDYAEYRANNYAMQWRPQASIHAWDRDRAFTAGSIYGGFQPSW
jgi:hypothetical protein